MNISYTFRLEGNRIGSLKGWLSASLYLKALLNFFSMASSVSFSLKNQLRKLEARMQG